MSLRTGDTGAATAAFSSACALLLLLLLVLAILLEAQGSGIRSSLSERGRREEVLVAPVIFTAGLKIFSFKCRFKTSSFFMLVDRSGNSVSEGFGKLDSSGEEQGEMEFDALEETMSGETVVLVLVVVAFIPRNCSN